MTVIDVFVDRPSVVPKRKISFGSKSPKSSSSSSSSSPLESRHHLMPEIQGCVVGNVLEGDSEKLYSMDANKTSPDANVDAQLIKGKEDTGSSLLYKKQKILVKTNRTPVRSRRKSRWKLKFHHQALPPEYLRHYKQQERKRRQTESSKNTHAKSKNKKVVLRKKSASERETSEKSENNGGEPEMADASTENAPVKREETGRDSERLKEVEPSNASSPPKPSPPEEKPHNPPEPNLRCRSTEELLTAGIAAIPHLDIDVSQNKAFLENLLTNQIEINRVEQKDRKVTDVKNSLTQFNKLKNIRHEERQKPFSIPPSGKIMNYSDLPYMGEITLDGIKPRRGRKPKKADICHLIYKNYGQVFPGAPGTKGGEGEDQGKKPVKWRSEANKSSQETKGRAGNSQDQRLESPLPTVSGLINHTEVQNRIINSLLEKRLTQGVKFKNNLLKGGKGEEAKPPENEEPLNLCIRDLQSLKIKLSRKHGNFYETKQRDSDGVKIKSELEDGGVKTEVINIDKSDSEMDSTDENEEEDDLAPFNLVTTELRESSDDDTFLNFNDQITLTRVKPPAKRTEPGEGSFCENISSPDVQMGSQEPQSPLLFWPGGFLPPSPFACCPKMPNEGPSFNFPGRGETSQERKPGKSKSEGHRMQLKRLAPHPNSTKAAHVITKRKRSAIFIPPVPAESTTNPTTEVSICKFKFTGGAKPSLQEKKMLSVDSGGNFRYYSGTGDKSMRGYEYFPRESLQQCQENTGCSPSGVFLTASALGSGEKIPEEIGHSGFFDSDFPLQVPAGPVKTGTDPKPKLKTKTKKPEPHKRLPDISCYQTLREHLLGSRADTSDVSLIPDDLDRDDGNLSDQSGEGFDLRNLPQGYFDKFKIQEETSRMSSKSDETSSRNKKLRKSRKSLAREKLEQTFKEKGFLIQTQQLESAEGATYCKFRQLRKFTRYLFRSWKDYLPGNVRNLSVDAGVENPEMVLGVPEGGIKMENLDADGIGFKSP